MAEKNSKPLVVYGSYGRWLDERNKNVHRQARFVVAAPSKAAIYRILPDLKNQVWTKTSNPQEIEAATSKPLAVFGRGDHDYDQPYYEITDLNSVCR